MSDDTPPVPTIANPNAPVIYVDELLGGGNLGTNVNLTFCVVRYDYSESPPRPYREVALQLVMPRNTFAQAAQFIGEAVLGPPQPHANVAAPSSVN